MHDVVLDEFEGFDDFENELAHIEQSVEYAEERLVADAQSMIVDAMARARVTKAELARMLDVSRPRVTQMLSDDCKNLTLKLLARTCFALDVPVKLIRADEVVARKTDMGWCIGTPWNDEVWHTSLPANQNDKGLVKRLAQAEPAQTLQPRGHLDEATLASLMADAVEPRRKVAA
jgi:hypothetical protein